jgi:hypothetical protein
VTELRDDALAFVQHNPPSTNRKEYDVAACLIPRGRHY